MTNSALVFSFVSSHGSASQLLVKLCSSSGSSLLRMNSRAISEKRVNGEYRVFSQKATLLGFFVRCFTACQRPARSIFPLS